jgi:hypothetical protein
MVRCAAMGETIVRQESDAGGGVEGEEQGKAG